jgi:hypothetical protein
MKRAVLMFAAMTLAAGSSLAQAPGASKKRPVGRITGGNALVKDKGRFKETWVHPDESLNRYDKVYLWNVAFQFRDVGDVKTSGTEAGVRTATGKEHFPVSEENQESFKHVIIDAYVKELKRSDRFALVDEPEPGTLIVRGAVMDIVSFVPPRTVRVDVHLAAVGEGLVAFELIDPETGLMQARVGDRRSIQLPKHSHETFAKPANFNALWPDVERWARSVASDLRRELEKRLKKKKKD